MAVSGATFDIKDFCNLVSMDAVCETILSSNLSGSRDALKRFVDAKNQACDYVAYRVYNPWLLSDQVYSLTREAREVQRIEEQTDQFVDDVINKKRARAVQPAEEERVSFVALQLREGGF